MQQRRCQKCRTWKTQSEFAPWAWENGGRCRSCEAQYQRERRLIPEKLAARKVYRRDYERKGLQKGRRGPQPERQGVPRPELRNAQRPTVMDCAKHEMLHGARRRAKAKGREYTLTAADIHIPARCPILGIRLGPNTGGRAATANSPSLDRIDPAGGYTPDNIQVISHRANTLKSDGTLEEFEALVSWLRDVEKFRS